MSGYTRQCTDLNLEDRDEDWRVELDTLKRFESHPILTLNGLSPRWILLQGKSPFQIDDVALVFKHPITEGDLQDRIQQKHEQYIKKKNNTLTPTTLESSFIRTEGEPLTCLCISDLGTCCRFSRWE